MDGLLDQKTCKHVQKVSINQLIETTFQELSKQDVNDTTQTWHRIEHHKEHKHITVGRLYMNSQSQTYKESVLSISECTNENFLITEKHILEGKFNIISDFSLINKHNQPLDYSTKFSKLFEFEQLHYQYWESDEIGGQDCWINGQTSTNYYLLNKTPNDLKMLYVFKNNEHYQLPHDLDNYHFIYTPDFTIKL